MEALRKTEQRYTYADYCAWDDGRRWELIEGIPYDMSAAPSGRHQRIIGEIFGQLWQFLKGKPCKVYIAPLDVRLNPDSGDDIVVQPDLLVVCDSSKLDDKACIGAPDMIVEILSPSSRKHDHLIKFRLYQQYGVREYWIVDPDANTVSVYVLENGKYIASAYGDTDTAPIHVLEGCTINLAEVFEE